MIIPFNRPFVSNLVPACMQDALRSDVHSGDGPFTQKCHAWLAQHLQAKRALLTTSCTHALEMTALLLELGPGDEVILPSFTFVSTANAYVLRGAKPVFADIREDTLNLDERQIEGLITSRTKAIVPMHYGGVGCEMDAIIEIARRRSLVVVEDNAHGIFGRYRGRPLGSFGALATQSFHETKNLSCGEGGALVIHDERYVERAEILREKGTNRSRFFRGQVDKYTWVDIGSSYLPSDLLAAMLWAQMEAGTEIQARRKNVWTYYARHLKDWADARGYRLPVVPPHCEPAWHLFYILFPDLGTRQAFLAHMKARGILAVFHYLPLHLSEMGRRLGGRPGDCPVTERVSDRLARLPFYTGLNEEELALVVAAMKEFPAG